MVSAVQPRRSVFQDGQVDQNSVLGRVLFYDVPTYEKPDQGSESNGTYQYNDVLTLSQPIGVKTPLIRDEIWHKLDDHAYIQSENIQLVRNDLNEPFEGVISKDGRLAEVTVPLTQAWPNGKKYPPHQQFFYGSVHWVYGLGQDAEGNLYYLVIEDRWNEAYYVDARHMRIIEDEELAPLSPVEDITRKSILVDTKDQMLYAFEDDELVMSTGVSTGVVTDDIDLITPVGDYFINYKRPTRHMVHSDKIGINDDELYGVPWVSYFTDTGIAFHGTYWHNDYSQPRSHGCVNMPIHAAKWLYLWSDPVIAPRAKLFVSNQGTAVKVI